MKTALGGAAFPTTNTAGLTINLATTGAGGMDTGTAPTSGYVATYAIYNPTTGAKALLGQNATSSAVGNVYGGVNMPAGYTASALVSVWPTNSSGQFIAAGQIDRLIYFPQGTALSTTTQQSSYTPFSVAGLLPPNAKTCGGNIILVSTANNNSMFAYVASTSGGANQCGTSGSNNGTNAGFQDAFAVLPVIAQTLYYIGSVAAGTMTLTVTLNQYTF